jgi:hypothetical protein
MLCIFNKPSGYLALMQTEDLVVPASVDQLLSDYAKRFHQIKTPRKLQWKKNLGTVKVRRHHLNLRGTYHGSRSRSSYE